MLNLILENFVMEIMLMIIVLDRNNTAYLQKYGT